MSMRCTDNSLNRSARQTRRLDENMPSEGGAPMRSESCF